MNQTRLALLLMLLCTGTQAWADPKSDCTQRQDRDRQLRGCTQYIEENPAPTRMLVAAHLSRASAYLHKGDKDLAIADFTKAIDLDGKNMLTYGNRGLAYLSKGDYDRAIADFTKAMEIADPKLDSRFLAGKYMIRGVARERKGDKELAIADFRRALAVDPDQRAAKDGLKRLGVSP